MSNDDPNQINLDRNNTVQKRGSILRPDLHRQISELLDQNYNISPDRIIVNVDRINFENYDKVDNQNHKASDKFSNKKPNMKQSQDIIPLNVKNRKVTYYSDSQSQTDLSFNDIKVKGDINPVLAEVEILGFFYMTEKERMEQLKLLLSDNYDNYKTAFDPCLEFEQYSRETEPTSGKYNVRNRSSSRLKYGQKDDEKCSIACQTFFVSPPVLPKSDIHKSTQTLNENSSPSDSSQSSPSHNLVTATTKTVIKKDPEQENENKIKEKFSIKNKKDDSLEYIQFSEYQTVGNKTEKLNSFLKVTESEKVIDGKKLVHSTIEMTSVIENKTTVTGISVKDAPEKFCIQTITPNETKQDTKPQEYLSQSDNISDKESKFEVISDLVFQTNIPKKKEVVLNIPKEPLVDSKFVPNKPPIDQGKISSPKVTKTETKFPKDQVLNSPSPKPARIDHESILSKDYKRNIYELNDKRAKSKPSVTEYKDDEVLSNEDSFNSPTSSTMSKPSINEYTINQIPKVIGISSNFKPDSRSPISTPDFNSPGLTKNLTSSDMGLNKKDSKTGGQNTISQLPGMFKFDNNRNLPAAKATSPKVLSANNKESIDNSNQFSIHQIPKMFKYEATVEQIKTMPDVNLQLSDSLKKRLNQNEMVMVGELPRNSNLKQIKPISVSTSDVSTTKPKTVSFKEKLIQQKALKSIDVNENNDIIEVDFDSYEAPTIRQVIKEIEVPVELPRNRGVSVDNLSFEKRVSFRTDPIGPISTKPVVKERSLAGKEFLLNYPYQNLEIDLNSYETEINQRYQSPPKAKISENSTNSDSKIDAKLEETKDKKKSEVEARMNNSLSTENILNETTKSILRVSSQNPFKSNLNSKKGLSVSFEKLLISENSSDDGVFEMSGISRLIEKKEIEKSQNVYNQTYNFNTKSKPLTKMEELIISNIEREYQKAVHRANQRKERVPEILKLLDQSSGKEMKNLQEELRFLMRKSRIDNELIQQYSFLDSNENFSDSTDLKVKSKKKRRSQSNYTGLANETDLESASLTSFSNKFLKNKNTKLISKKLNKNDYFKSSNKTLESGYSSLEDSFNDLKSDLENEKKKITPKVSKINNENTGDLTNERVEPKLKLEVSLNDNEYNVDKRNPRKPRNNKSNNDSTDQNKNTNNSKNNIISSNKIESGRSVPMNQTTEQGSSSKSSGSNNQSVASEKDSSSNQASPQNNNQNNSNNKNDEDDDDDDERRKKKNILDNRRNVNYQEPDRIEINYIEEDELDNLDLENYDIYQNPETGESLLIDLRTKESFVILPKNWRESENSFYFAEEDLDLNSLEIYVDERNNRKYIFDEQTLKPYFIVKSHLIKKLSKNLGQKMDQSQIIKDSAQVIQMKHSDADESNDSGIETDYVEEKELDNLNLVDFDFKVDETSGETVLISRSNVNLRWIIIPNDWRTIENLPYVSEEDISLVQIDIYTDPKSKRKYVIDEQSGQRYYIVPKFRKDIRNFISSRPLDLNTKTTTNDKPSGQSPPDILKSSLKNKQDETKPNQDNNLKREKSSIMLGDERVENLENEPSNLKLRESEAKSPARKTRFDPNLPLSFKNYNLFENQNKLIIKQPGKPGHLINNNNNNTNINNNRPFTNNTNNMNNKNQPNDKKQKPPKTKKQIDKEQAKKLALAKMKYEASRQAFFQQKLPDVGKLWLHQLLIEQKNQRKRMDNLIKGYNSSKNLNTDDIDPNAYLDQYGKPKAWRSLNQLTDPTVDSNDQSLDRDRLLDIKIHGYDRFDKSKRKRNIFDEDENKHKHGKDYQLSLDPNNSSFGGFRDYDYIRAVLSEDFVESKEYRPMQLNRYYRALVPHTKLNLRQQFLTTPRYLKPTWEDVLKQSDKMQPKIILINDDELILTKNRNCNVYVQYEYKNDAVMGANQLYQLMLPDRGPTNPARPLMISPAKLSKVMEMKQKTRPELALRDAPVFVYHQDGNAFYENLAQYLAGNQAKLSPKTARKILQFSDLKEFEDYLSSKITRNEAKRLAEMSGEDIINIDSIQRDLLNIIKDKKETNGEPSYYHMNCQYDRLRPKGEEDNETREYEVSGSIMKSTFIGFGNNGEPKRVRFNELPQNVMNIMREASVQDSKK